MNTFLTDEAVDFQSQSISVHPRFQPFLDSIEAEITTGHGPHAAVSLAVETFNAVAKLVEIQCGGGAPDRQMAEAGVELPDLIQLLDHLGDRIDSLFKQIH